MTHLQAGLPCIAAVWQSPNSMNMSLATHSSQPHFTAYLKHWSETLQWSPHNAAALLSANLPALLPTTIQCAIIRE